MECKPLQQAIDSVIRDWREFTPPPKSFIDDNYSSPQYSSLGIIPYISTLKLFENSPIDYSIHGEPISFALKMEREHIIHIALVKFRVVPVSQPFILPSQSECQELMQFLSLAYSKLRFAVSTLSKWRNGCRHIDASLLLSLGYMQICSSLTDTSFICVDTAQGCTLDYITDSPIIVSKKTIAEEIRAVNEEYRILSSQLMSKSH